MPTTDSKREGLERVLKATGPPQDGEMTATLSPAHRRLGFTSGRDHHFLVIDEPI